MKTLAAIAAVALSVSFAARAQTAPPPPPLDFAPQTQVQVPAVTAPADPESPLDVSKYPSGERSQIWEQYARRNQLSVNILYPVSGAILIGVASGLWSSLGSSDPLGAISLPIEYERSFTRNLSAFGMVQPTFATGLGSSEFSMAVGGGGRLYISGNAPQGFWMGAEVDHALGSQAFTSRLEAGFNTMFDSGLTLSLGAGLGITYASDVINPLTGLNIPFFPAAGLRFCLGYAF